MSKKSRFATVWASATDIGRQFGLSGIAVNRVLEREGHRDPALKAPTAAALAEGWALATPLADGTPHFMWSRRKVASLLGATQSRLTPSEARTESLLREICRLEREHPDAAHKLFPGLMEAYKDLAFSRREIQSVCARLKMPARADEFCQLLEVRD